MTPKRLLIAPISPAAGPLYQQIVDGLKREVSEGRLPPGTALPSFRALAEDLLVSVITVKRAYEDLERDGIIYRRQGLGTFVAEAARDRSREVKRQRAERCCATRFARPPKPASAPTRSLRFCTLIRHEGATHHAAPALEIRGLRKSYSRFTLGPLDLTVPTRRHLRLRRPERRRQDDDDRSGDRDGREVRRARSPCSVATTSATRSR